jgi:hypothetical protein
VVFGESDPIHGHIEIWSDKLKRGGLWWKWPYRRGTTVTVYVKKCSSTNWDHSSQQI